MSEQILQILKKLESHEIDTEVASSEIDGIFDREGENVDIDLISDENKDYKLARGLSIRVKSDEGKNIRIRVPFWLAKAGLRFAGKRTKVSDNEIKQENQSDNKNSFNYKDAKVIIDELRKYKGLTLVEVQTPKEYVKIKIV